MFSHVLIVVGGITDQWRSNQVPAVTPYNVDDLKAVVAKNTAMRQREMIEAETLLREEKNSFIG